MIAGAPGSLAFLVFDIDGESPLAGLVNGDFTKAVYANGAASSAVAVVAEIGGGAYSMTITPDVPGAWLVTARDPLGAVHSFRFDASAVDVVAEVELVRKTVTNRLETSFDAQEIRLYDDDGVTVIKRWPVEAEEGDVLPFVGAITKRKAPTS